MVFITYANWCSVAASISFSVWVFAERINESDPCVGAVFGLPSMEVCREEEKCLLVFVCK